MLELRELVRIIMQIWKQLIIMLALMLSLSIVHAGSCSPKSKSCPKGCDTDVCCGQMGGVSYCDSSAGRLVCNNGYYSSCYCTRHAVMDLQLISGCCLWQGGVLTVSATGAVICNNGSVSEVCTLQTPTQSVATW